MRQIHSSQAEKAYTELRKLLLGHLADPGSRLTEETCAQMVQVNRGDIRLALARLSAEGLLARGEKGGYFVPKITEAQREELTEARLLLESAAVKLAVKRATAEDFQELEQICDDMELMADRGYRMGVNEADVRFHEKLVHSAHNAKLYQLYRLANLPLSYGVPVAVKRSVVELMSDVDHHREILAALKNGNEQEVVDLLYKGVYNRGNQNQ